MKKTSRIAFFGTPQFAVTVLEKLKEAGIVPALIVTAPDKPAGRGLALTPPPVKEWAIKEDVTYLQPRTLKGDDPEKDLLINSDWDLFIVAAYGKILQADILKLPHGGTLNVHPSLLPRFRGASPIESQILADEKVVGVSIMLMDEEMDHGPVVAAVEITPDPWPLPAQSLESLLAEEGGALLAEVIPLWMHDKSVIQNQAWEEGEEPTLKIEPQKHSLVTFTKKIQKEDGLIDLADDPYQNYLKYCAYDQWPGTFFFLEHHGKKMRVKITEAAYERGSFTPLRVVPEGKKEMDYQDFLRGYKAGETVTR